MSMKMKWIGAVALLSALLVWGPAKAWKNPPAVAGESRLVGVVCIESGIDFFTEAAKESEQVVRHMIDFLFQRGLCTINPNGFRVTLSEMKKAFSDYEGAAVEVWRIETQAGPDMFTWNYMGFLSDKKDIKLMPGQRRAFIQV